MSIDLRITAAEDAAYQVHGVTRVVKQLPVETRRGTTDVRVSVFGDATERPPVLLLHGIGSAQVLAAPLLPFLADRQVIAPDWPAHGLSGPCVLSPEHDMRDHARTVVESVLDGFGVPAADLVGHSMGAQFSLYAGAGLPDRVRRLVLLGAPGAAFPGIRPLLAMKLVAMHRVGPRLLARPMSPRAFDRFNNQALGRGALAGHDEIRAALRALSLHTANAASLASFFRAMLWHGRVRAGVPLDERELGRVTQPTLLVWGEEDVFLRPSEVARSIAALPEAHLVRVPQAGHAPWLHATELAGSSVVRHLDGGGNAHPRRTPEPPRPA